MSSPADDASLLELILEYIWIPIVAAIVRVFVKMSGLETRAALLEQSREIQREQRREDRESRKAYHEAIAARFDKLEALIKSQNDKK